jgi:hypothetical protein
MASKPIEGKSNLIAFLPTACTALAVVRTDFAQSKLTILGDSDESVVTVRYDRPWVQYYDDASSRTSIQVPKRVLTKESGYFKAMLSGSFVVRKPPFNFDLLVLLQSYRKQAQASSSSMMTQTVQAFMPSYARWQEATHTICFSETLGPPTTELSRTCTSSPTSTVCIPAPAGDRSPAAPGLHSHVGRPGTRRSSRVG